MSPRCLCPQCPVTTVGLSVPHSLTETIECLQGHIDQLQSQVDELKSSQRRRSQGKCDQDKPAPSFSGLKELYDLRQ